MIDLVGKNLGPYQLQNAILQGGMATVYRAYQPLLERYVAVKVMFPNVDPQFAQRFAREARAVAQLQHPNIVQIYDFGEQDGQFYIAMQYIENGRSLNEFKGQMLPIEQALKIAASTLSALDHAHKRGIVHRDIKPSNILLAGDMWPMLSDFGISHFVKDTDSTNLTASGMIIGTPAYMAPEQAEGRSVDARSDLYALGVVLYELLTGHVPFRADTSMGMLAARLTQQPRPPREYRDELPLVVEAMIMRALARRPEARYQTADEMFREVQQTLSAMQLDRSGLALEPSGSSYVPPVDSSVHTRAAREIHTTSLPVPLVPSTSQSSVSQPESREKVSDSYVPATAVKWLAGGLLLLALLIAIPLLLTNKVVLLPTTNSTLYLILTFALCSIICWILVTSLLTGITKPVYTQLRKLRRQVPQNAPASTAASEPSFYTFSGAQTPTIVGSSVRQQPSASGVPIKYADLLHPVGHKIIEDLVVHQNYEWLWRSIAYGVGGRYLLTGYGSFGGTSLIQCAIDKARRELQRERLTESALFALYLHVTKETNESFDLRAEHVTLGRVQRKPDNNTNVDRLRPYADQYHVPGKTMTQLLDFSLKRTLSGGFFTRTDMAAVAQESSNTDYNLSSLANDLRDFLENKQNAASLRQIVNNLANSKSLPSNIVIVIDKIQYSSTLKRLLLSELFRNKKVKIIVLARKEDVNTWDNIDTLLEKSGFVLHYIPSIWGGDLSRLLFDSGLNIHNQADFADFCRHLDFVSKGALTNIIKELKQSNYILPGPRGAVANIARLGDDVWRNAWLQRLLDCNKDNIVGSRVGGKYRTEKQDRARIAIYDLLEWIERHSPFTQKQLVAYERTLPVTITDDEQTATETIQCLLYVLVENMYLSFKRPYYHVIWSHDGAPEPKMINTQALFNGRKRERKQTGDDPNKTVTIPIDGDDPGPSPLRTGVFISYSRKDKDWHDRLQTNLKPLGRTKTIDVWDDTRIKAGSTWKKEIQRALASAKVAVLLVSPDFLASDFIAEQELPTLLAAARQEGLIILWVPVRASAFETTPIAEYQAALDPKRPLKELRSADVDRELVEICKKIAAAANAG